jgi:hypothetical protein
MEHTIIYSVLLDMTVDRVTATNGILQPIVKP